ncbi:MAG: VTT domain-containing protein, partial [Candidatus Lokiarchaeota archaeon]|nr:VTT domain-containing protein [Candidatus Lokiarchaeota archaeon]
MSARQNMSSITEGANYIWALLISLVICFLGSASIGFPIPFPFVLFSLSNSILLRYMDIMGLNLDQVLGNSSFWFEILGIALIGGLGSALGEFTGYYVGYSAKKLGEKKDAGFIKNIDGFGKIVLSNKKRTPLIIFLFALSPLPDDILFLPLGMMKYPFWKCIIPGWLGKNITTIFYCSWPILIKLGLTFLGEGTTNGFSEIITETVLLLFTITIMFFIMSFDWNKYLKERKEKKDKKIP